MKGLAFIPELESLRGLAATSVVAFHAYGMRNDTAVTGLAAVVFFFVLSGFVLARSLEGNPSVPTFFIHRVLRLVPAAAVCVVVYAALYWLFGFSVGYAGPYSGLDLLLDALMIRSEINGVMWSMTVECLASPIIILAFFTCLRFGSLPLIAASVALFGLSFWGSYVHLLGGFTNLAPLYAFLIGVLLHFACSAGYRTRFSATLAVIALVIFAACSLHKQTSPLILAETLSGGAVVLFVATTPDIILSRLLRISAARFIGRISYSLYLYHPIGLVLAERTQPKSWLALFALGLVLTLPMAWLSWRFVERPAAKLKSATRPIPVTAPA